MGRAPGRVVDAGSARWDDLEAFGLMADGLRAGRTLQAIGEDARTPFKSARMLYLRLRRLESAFGRRLVDRRPWGRDARLTPAGETLAAGVRDLLAVRRRLHLALAEPEKPSLRIATHATYIALLLPAIIERRQRAGKPPTALALEPLVMREFPEAVAAVADGRADIAFYMSPPGERRVRLPRGVRGEPLLDTEMLVLCARTHRFAARLRADPAATVAVEELADEVVIGRPFFRAFVPPPTGRGGWVEVPHSLDMLFYVRLGIGVGFHSRVAYELFGKQRDIVALPLSPPVRTSLWLLRPRKRLRRLDDAAEEFIEDSRSFCRDLRKTASGPPPW